MWIIHKTEGAPVIVDYNPTYYNLVGEVEYDNEYGNLTTDFMKIKPGLMHKANGGYLIVQAQDLLEQCAGLGGSPKDNKDKGDNHRKS